MEIKLTLALPRDEISIPIVRRICSQSLRVLGVEDDCIADLELALTEACANVLKHARAEDEYEVSTGINDRMAVVEVVDRGAGFDSGALGRMDADLAAETGRGIQLIRALVDEVHFLPATADGSGTRVHLEKELRWVVGSPMERLTRQEVHHGPWADDEALGDAPQPRTAGPGA